MTGPPGLAAGGSRAGRLRQSGLGGPGANLDHPGSATHRPGAPGGHPRRGQRTQDQGGTHSVFSLYVSRCASEPETEAELAACQAIDEEWGNTDATDPRSFKTAQFVTTRLGALTHASRTGLGPSMGRPTLFRLGSLTDGKLWLVYHVILQDGTRGNELRERERHEAWLGEILASVQLIP